MGTTSQQPHMEVSRTLGIIEQFHLEWSIWMFLSIMNMDAIDTIDGRSAIKSDNLQVQSMGRICAVRVITIDSVGCHFLELKFELRTPTPFIYRVFHSPHFQSPKNFRKGDPSDPLVCQPKMFIDSALGKPRFDVPNSVAGMRGIAIAAHTRVTIEGLEFIRGSWWAALSNLLNTLIASVKFSRDQGFKEWSKIVVMEISRHRVFRHRTPHGSQLNSPVCWTMHRPSARPL